MEMAPSTPTTNEWLLSVTQIWMLSGSDLRPRLTSGHGGSAFWRHRHRRCGYDVPHFCREDQLINAAPDVKHSSEVTDLSQWQGSIWSFLVGFQLPAGTRVGSDQWWTGCLCQPESENFCRVKVQHWDRLCIYLWINIKTLTLPLWSPLLCI